MARCVIVEDSEIIRAVARAALEDLGFKVALAETAREGIAACEDGAVLVLLDWDLPSLGALDFLKDAAALETPPTIVLTATENDSRQFALARAAGAAYHLLKPYDPARLEAALREAGFPPPVEALAERVAG